MLMNNKTLIFRLHSSMEDTFIKIIGLVATDEEDVESQFFFFVPFFGSVK